MVTVHVYPGGDLIEHDTDGGDCMCGPTTEFVQGDESSGWLVIHHSLDGREINRPSTTAPFPADD
jgi:hypothetical protein